jgi:hypothetical protein
MAEDKQPDNDDKKVNTSGGSYVGDNAEYVNRFETISAKF